MGDQKVPSPPPQPRLSLHFAFVNKSRNPSRQLSLISNNRGKRRDSKEKSQLDGVDRLHRQAKTCLAAVAKAVKTTIRPTFRAIGSRFRESYEILQNKI